VTKVFGRKDMYKRRYTEVEKRSRRPEG